MQLSVKSLKGLFTTSRITHFWLIANTLYTALGQFLLYRIILNYHGKESMGIWAIFMSVLSISQFSSLGFGATMLRLVPSLISAQNGNRIKLVLATVNLANLFIATGITILIFFPGYLLGASLFQPEQLDVFKWLLIYGLAGLIVYNFSFTLINLLDGFNQFRLRAKLQMATYTIYLAMAIVFLRYDGIVGIAKAFLLFNILFLLILLAVAHLKLKQQGLLSLRFNAWAFSQLWQVGFKFQSVNFLMMLFDLAVKFYVTRSFSLNTTAVYETANKISAQFRHLSFASNQTLLPQVVSSSTTEAKRTLYEGRFRKTRLFMISFTLLVLGFTPFASFVFYNQFSEEFFLTAAILQIAWFASGIASPAYYVLLASEKLNQMIGLHCLFLVFTILLFSLQQTMEVPSVAYLAAFIPSVSLLILACTLNILASRTLQARSFMQVFAKDVASIALAAVGFWITYQFYGFLPAQICLWVACSLIGFLIWQKNKTTHTA